MTADEKRLVREQCLGARRARGAAEIISARAAVREVVLARCAAQRWSAVAGYVPLRTEPGSTELLDELGARGVRVIVPLLLPDNDLDWVPWGIADAAPLGSSAIGSVDAVLVPALAVDRRGTRLGRGGGSYDRALRRVRAGAEVAALLFDGEVLDLVPSEEWDVPVAAVATPSGWESLRAQPG